MAMAVGLIACGEQQFEYSPRREVMISDMEQGSDNFASDSAAVSAGNWYLFNDQTPGAVQENSVSHDEKIITLLDEPRGESRYAAHSSGEGFITWGAGIGMTFSPRLQPWVVFDASEFVGIGFWIKGEIENNTSKLPLRVQLPDKNTLCPSATCNDHFGINIELPHEWRYVELQFSEFEASSSGTAIRSFNPALFRDVQFEYRGGRRFEIWIDDIRFIRSH